VYELRFQLGDYFTAQGITTPTPPFLDEVPVRFGIADAQAAYHVPLLASPWSYGTYRGS
jgi:5-hydroxyisourate hydrolase